MNKTKNDDNDIERQIEMSKRLQKVVEYTNKSVVSFAKSLDLHPSGTYKFLNYTKDTAIKYLSTPYFIKLCETYPEISLNWLFTGMGEMLAPGGEGVYHTESKTELEIDNILNSIIINSKTAIFMAESLKQTSEKENKSPNVFPKRSE